MGGQRCPGHTSKDLAKKRDALGAVQAASARGEAPPTKVNKAKQAYWKVLVDWGSTLDGAASLREQLAADPTGPSAAGLRRAIDEGALLAQNNRAVENAWRADRDKGPLPTPLPYTFAQEAEQAAENAARAAQEAESAADPLGLRAAATLAPTVTLPTIRPALPTQRPVAAMPASPVTPAGLPTSRPNAAATAAAFQQLAERETELIRERQAREQAEAAAERTRAMAELQARESAVQIAEVRMEAAQAVAAATEQPQERAQREEVRAQAVARNEEVARLRGQVVKEGEASVKWMKTVGITKVTAPAATWQGPARWRDGQAPSLADNWQAMRDGRAKYGMQFDTLARRYADRLAPAEVYEACGRLDSLGRAFMAGGQQSEKAYASYKHIDPDTVKQARRAAIGSAFGPNETNRLAKQYVFANADGVLNRALENNAKKATRQPVSALTVRAFGTVERAQQSWNGLLSRFGLRPATA